MNSILAQVRARGGARTLPPPDGGVDAKALAARLREKIAGEIRFDAGTRALYATDGSNYRQVPIGVVVPRTADDIVETLAACREFRAPVLSRGGGTSLAGQCCNVAVVMDMSKYYNQVLGIDRAAKLGRVHPGVVLDTLRKEARQVGLTFGPDPSTHTHCTLGGMIGNNSCGVHSIMSTFQGLGSRTSDNLHELEVMTYDGLRLRVGRTSDDELKRLLAEPGRRGDIYRGLHRIREKYAPLIRARYPKIPRRVSGYNLDELLPEKGFHVARALAGTEGTCVTILEATMHLVDEPKARTLVVVGYDSVAEAADHGQEVMAHRPIGLEGLDEKLLDFMRHRHMHLKDLGLIPPGKGWLVVEFGGDSKEESDAKGRALMADLAKNGGHPRMRLYDDPKEEKMVWEVRESGLGATALVPGEPDAWEGWEDSAVEPARLGDYLRDFDQLLKKYAYNSSLYGHFGDGCVHCRINFDFVSQEGIDKYRRFIDEAADTVLKHGGSLSGEHGDGQSRAELLPKMFGPELVEAFREFKAVWDPLNRMNPGKVVDAYKATENLRLGTDYRPATPMTRLHFPEDQDSFARSAMRCVGVGNCRTHEGGTMCPSYMVTKEEQHSTRGRSRLLFEMLQGQVITDGWKSEAVRESLDFCLACKGCKGECPVNVDMASYKAEFLSHYYEGKLRPLHAYAFGLIGKLAPLGAAFPRLSNFFLRFPPAAALAKAVIGIAPQRTIPLFAPQTFKRWFRQRRATAGVPGAPKVLLWADTFNNHYHPETAQAAVRVLETLGWEVAVPRRHLCCGRPLYDYGMLDLAKRWLLHILDTLRDDIRAGIPMVVLEPSCASVFRDELLRLLPHDDDAQRLKKQTFLLSEFLAKYAPGHDYGSLKRKAVVHGHCHHKAVMKMTAEEEILEKLGLDLEKLDSGCCGMAGAFGFEKEHYDVSIACGERVLLPAVRQAAADTLLIADGFSCREQIRQTTGREALHLAQVIDLAQHGG